MHDWRARTAGVSDGVATVGAIVGRYALHDAADHVGREPAANQEPHLPHAAGGIGSRCAVLAAPHRHGAAQFCLLQGLAGVGVEADAMLLQLLLDAPVAVARLPRMHAALGKTGIRQMAVLLQPLQHRVDLCRSGRRIDAFSVVMPGAFAALITLIDNTFAGNRGRVVAGKSTANLGNHDQILDATDQQSGF